MEGRTLFSLMMQGGVVMWPLFALLVTTLVVVCERTIVFVGAARTGMCRSREELESPLAILDFIAMLAPVLGFLGTVTGMIGAFKAVSQATSVQLQVVASGLYEALFTTAFGLIISIVATLFSFLLDMVIDRLCKENSVRA